MWATVYIVNFFARATGVKSRWFCAIGRIDRKERKRSAGQEVKALFPKFMDIPGVLAFPVQPPSFGQSPRDYAG